MPRNNADTLKKRPASSDFGAAPIVELAQGGAGVFAGEDDALSADEEKFVAAFVDYWARRGAGLVRIRA
jgi:hypothetical protein